MVSFSKPPPRSSQGFILSAQGVSLSVLGVILNAPGLILTAPGLILSAPGLILSAPGISLSVLGINLSAPGLILSALGKPKHTSLNVFGGPGPHSEWPGSWDHSILASRHAGILGSESWDRGILASRHPGIRGHPGIPASQHPGILASSTLTQPQRLLHLNAYSTSTLIPLKTCIRVLIKRKFSEFH